MAKNQNYVKKDFYIALVLTSIFMALYLVSRYGIRISSDDELSKLMWSYEFVNVLSSLGLICSFLLIPIGVYMCMERFLCIKLQLECNVVRGKRKLLLGLGMAVSICFGYGCLDSMDDMAGYYVTYKSLSVYFGSVEGFGHYAVVWAGVMVCWLFGFILSILWMWRIDVNGICDRGKRDWTALTISVILLAILIFMTHVGGGHIHGYLEEKLKIRYYEQNGSDALPYEIIYE
ncbi:MAG: hypothetical protein NC094_13510 [Bacteroidales bacterium]|nr:hypothetical protein [Lachnoclostridium sp.]MCM1384820.1 hypothetical protein [Lachnoclostridium sp.]MCM1466421.1 hypothetical protein [Bacteroidales bacterium]